MILRIPARIAAFLAILIFAAVVAVDVYGIGQGKLLSQPIWDDVGLKRLGHYTIWFLALVVPALVLIPRVFIPLAAGLVLVATAISAGPQSVFAVVFFLVSARSLGSLILRGDQCVRATLAGIGIYIFIATFLVRFPVNYPMVWALLLAAPIIADLRATGRRAVRWGRALFDIRLTSWQERTAFALLLFALLMDWLVTLKPETGTDGLAMHLAVVTDIAAHHVLTFQPGRFVWAVMPMGADWIFAITGLLGGEMAVRLLNLAMLLLVELQLYALMRRWVPRPVSLLLLALFTTTPMVQMVTGSLFVENLLTAVILGVVAALLTFSETGEKKSLYLAMALSGTALATKFGALSMVGVIVPLALWELSRRRMPLATVTLASMLFLGAAAPAYTIAWWKTGDPLYPFLNKTFPSPLVDHDADFNDGRFRQPITWHTPFDLTFRTHEYYEGMDGSLGFQYLLLVPFGLLAAIVVKRRTAAMPALIAATGLVVVLIALPNLRYMYPEMALFAVPFAAFLAWLSANRRWLYLASLTFVTACIGLNIWFFPSAGWYQKDFYAKNPFSPVGREAYLRDYAPVRYVVQEFSHKHAGSRVYLATASADIADVNGDPYGAFIHQWGIRMKVRETHGIPNLARLFRQWRIRYFVVEDTTGDQSSTMHDFIQACTQEEFRDLSFSVTVLRPECDTDDQGKLEAQAASVYPPLRVMQKGIYDDADAAVQFRGDWTHSRAFGRAERGTISFSDGADSAALLAFEGTAVTYVFTRAPNRGKAEVLIDGASRGTVNLYSPDTEWQSQERFCCLGIGRHTVMVRVTGEKAQASTDKFVDLDSFVVE
jgi:hypothetical protein